MSLATGRASSQAGNFSCTVTSADRLFRCRQFNDEQKSGRNNTVREVQLEVVTTDPDVEGNLLALKLSL